MSIQTFSAIVFTHLDFLLADPEFSVKEHVYGDEPFSGGEIEFRSPNTILSIELDRGEVRAELGPANEPEISKLSLAQIVEYFSQGNDRSLLGIDGNPPYKMEDWVELKMSAIVKALLKYCVPFLRGDFSQWFDI